MKRNTIKIDVKANRIGVISKITEMLGSIGIVSSSGTADKKNNFVLSFEGKLNPMQVRLIQLFLFDIRTMASDFEFTQTPDIFDFEDYIGTDLDGVSQAHQMDQLFEEFDQLIDKTLGGETTEFKQQARVEICKVWKERIEDWLANGGC